MSGLIIDYLRTGLFSERPVTMTPAPQGLALYWSSDESILSVWQAPDWIDIPLAGLAMLIAGGTTGQVLAKINDDDFAVEWADLASNFSALTDVDWSTPPVDGQIFVWDEASGKLIPSDFPNSFPEAPEDGTPYARQDADWVSVSGSGIPEAPIDGNQYARKDAGWEVVASGGGALVGNSGGIFDKLTQARYSFTDTVWTNGDLHDGLVTFGDLIGMFLDVYTSSGTFQYGTNATFVVPAGKVATLLWYVGSGNSRTNWTYYRHRIYNVTAGTEYRLSNTGSVDSSGFVVPDGANNSLVNPIKVGVAGDVIRLEASSSGDSNSRTVYGACIIALADATTGAWSLPTLSSADAPSDGTNYARKDGAWNQLGTMAAESSTAFVRNQIPTTGEVVFAVGTNYSRWTQHPGTTSTAAGIQSFRVGGGTLAAPTDTPANYHVFSQRSEFYYGGAYRLSSRWRQVLKPATPSNTDAGSIQIFEVCPPGSGSVSELYRWDYANGLSVYGSANIVIDSDRLWRNRVYTVATLPTPGIQGRQAYASNCRVFDGAGVMESAGAGTGGLVTDNGTSWRIAGTNITASA